MESGNHAFVIIIHVACLILNALIHSTSTCQRVDQMVLNDHQAADSI
jgi:hypothetical protein